MKLILGSASPQGTWLLKWQLRDEMAQCHSRDKRPGQREAALCKDGNEGSSCPQMLVKHPWEAVAESVFPILASRWCCLRLSHRKGWYRVAVVYSSQLHWLGQQVGGPLCDTDSVVALKHISVSEGSIAHISLSQSGI